MHLGQFLGFITGQHWRKPMIFATIEPLLGLTYTHIVEGGVNFISLGHLLVYISQIDFLFIKKR